jgi:lipopolysaccharide transport system ATP-binding protein
MSEPVIQVRNLSKLYNIGKKENAYRTLRDSMTDAMTAPFRKMGALLRGHATGASELNEELWALHHLSFEINRGEVVGVIGKNGAGKSTLLKVLSRITLPTSGNAEILGRVGSLLEVGTGFHPELTGRENLFLNGAILGMKKAEITARIDDIVAFSGVEKFMDTPVKHYSSGMYLRLAFAVAAHFEPEILLVDEVLAVGDLAFQKKCLGKMGDIAREGRTILMVSHNMVAVQNLCDRGIWLDSGQVIMDGDIDSVVNAYIKSTATSNDTALESKKRTGTGEARVISTRLLDTEGNTCDTFPMGATILCELDVEFKRSFDTIEFMALDIKRADTGLNVLHLTNTDSGFRLERIRPGKMRYRIAMPDCMLYPGGYEISIWIGDVRDHEYDFIREALSFYMVQSSVSQRTSNFFQDKGVFHLPTSWGQSELLDSVSAK